MKRLTLSFLLSPLCFLLSFSQVTFIIDSLPDYTPVGEQIYIAGNFTGWQPGLPEYALSKDAYDQWTITLQEQPQGTVIQYKFTRGSWETVEKGPNGEEIGNRVFTYGNGDTVHVIIYNWRQDGGGGEHTAAENVSVMDENFYIPQLDRTRRIWIYLPPDYETSGIRYPVLYMHDGQNLFDAATSFAGEWEVDETLNELAGQGLAVPIVVGVDNGGENRIGEYTPWPRQGYGGGDGDLYIDFIIETLKPYIDSQYRTLPEREFTGIMGSSLGGLISHYGALKHQELFSRAGIFSPSYWWSDEIWPFTSGSGRQQPMRLYLLAGTLEGYNTAENTEAMRDTLYSLGFNSSEISSKIVTGAQHNEAFWRQEFGEAYLWMFASYALQIDPASIEKKVLLYPNPSNGRIMLSLVPQDSVSLWRILDQKGNAVTGTDVLNGNEIDVGFLDTGMYIIQFTIDNQVVSRVFIKK